MGAGPQVGRGKLAAGTSSLFLFFACVSTLWGGGFLQCPQEHTQACSLPLASPGPHMFCLPPSGVHGPVVGGGWGPRGRARAWAREPVVSAALGRWRYGWWLGGRVPQGAGGIPPNPHSPPCKQWANPLGLCIGHCLGLLSDCTWSLVV